MSLGILAAVSSAICCGFIPVFTKWMQNLGMTTVEVLFYRFSVVFIITGMILLMKKVPFRITFRQVITLMIMTVFGYGGATLLLASSFHYLPIGIASMLYFTYPIFVLIIMTFVFKEKLTKIKVLAFGLAILAILFLMEFNLTFFNIGSLLASGAGLAYAIYLICIQKSAVSQLNNLLTVFYLAGFSCIFFAAQGLIMKIPDFLSADPMQLFLGFCVGAITVYVLGAIAFSIKQIGSTKTSLIISFEAVVSLVLGIMIFNDPWTILTWIGSGLLTLAVVLISRENSEGSSKEGENEWR